MLTPGDRRVKIPDPASALEALAPSQPLELKPAARMTDGRGHPILLIVGAVLAASIAVGLGAARAGVPVLVTFLALAMLLGPDGRGGIEFDDAEQARSVGVVCLVAILYEGGLSTS